MKNGGVVQKQLSCVYSNSEERDANTFYRDHYPERLQHCS